MNDVTRRTFVKESALFTAGLLSAQLPASGETFSAETVRAENKGIGKNLDPVWIKSLYERGTVTTYRKSKNELQYIGMPIGGLHTGTLYLGGDGRLWLWDIFNLNQEGVNPLEVPWVNQVQLGPGKVRSRDGSAYIAPAKSDEIRPLAQGFALKLEYDGKTIVRHLQESDWGEVSFETTYPVATIRYTDKALPVSVTMLAYSPFIPLDIDKSSLPATVFSIDVTNTGTQPVQVSIAGWLENKTALHTAMMSRQQRRNDTFTGNGLRGVYSSLEKAGYGSKGIETNFDYGTLCLAGLQADTTTSAHIDTVTGEGVFQTVSTQSVIKSAQQPLVGNVVSRQSIQAGQSGQFTFVISWHTPNFSIHDGKHLPEADRGRYYANQFRNAKEVAEYVAANFDTLSSQTLLWKTTWADSSLPHWFLERTFLNVSSLATTTSHRFKSGRYWAWEGVGACEGNCAHVWQYAQAPARLFPAMERDNRERVDLGLSLQPDGGIWFRGEYDKRPAIDGQAGRVLGCYREHQMSADATFLRTNWEKIKRATQFIINQDKNGDGMEDTPLENTLDAIWDGEIAWLVGLCIAAVKAGEQMATDMNDVAFATRCREYVQKGQQNMETHLFNGEYFIHRPDVQKGRAKLGSYNTCHIDQVYGQSWAFQVGLDRILDKPKTVSALRSLWKYNFLSDVGPYIATPDHQGGRPYAISGDGGMLMNTNPKNEPKPYGDNVTWQMGYFHECMSGFEHQVAAHMMAEGMTDEALVLTRAIHDRYHAAKRNPFNEIECSDHYARAMASYGTFITACGFEYHGPKGYIRFAPKWNRDAFKAPFTAAEGWGTYSQEGDRQQTHRFDVKHGSLNLKTIGLEKVSAGKIKRCTVTLGAETIPARFVQKRQEIRIELEKSVRIPANGVLVVSIAIA